MQSTTKPAVFILSAEDQNLVCSVLEARFIADDPQKLVDLIPDAHSDDPSLWDRSYELDEPAWRHIATTFNVVFDAADLDDRDIIVNLSRGKWLTPLPYLVHTGYELLLMLDGRKPFAIFHVSYPDADGEDFFEISFEPHVLSGRIIKHVRDEPFDKPIKNRNGRSFEGLRHIYYTLPGEEWRVEANKVLWHQLSYVAWNESMERIWGTLLGYTDTQNDLWIALLKHEGENWGSVNLYAVVSKPVLDWILASGCRALPWAPPASEIKLMLHWPRPDLIEMHRWMEATQTAAVIRFGLNRKFLKDHKEVLENGVRSYRILPCFITQLNASLARPIEIIVERRRAGLLYLTTRNEAAGIGED